MDLDSPSGYIHSTPLHLSAKKAASKRGESHDIKDICPGYNTNNYLTGWHIAYRTI